MIGRKSRPGRRPDIGGPPPEKARFETVIHCLPSGGGEIDSSTLIKKLRDKVGMSRASAIRWLKEAQRRRIVDCRVDGRRRFYSFAMTGFMDAAAAKSFLNVLSITFLREAPGLVPEYQNSLKDMTLFWEQATSALVISLERLLFSAQSISFAQADPRRMPSVEVVKRQAEVLTETFVKPWIADLVVSLHRFLANERARNQVIPRRSDGLLGAPSSTEGYRRGWGRTFSTAQKRWIKRKQSGPWGEYLKRQMAEEDARIHARFRIDPSP